MDVDEDSCQNNYLLTPEYDRMVLCICDLYQYLICWQICYFVMPFNVFRGFHELVCFSTFVIANISFTCFTRGISFYILVK